MQFPQHLIFACALGAAGAANAAELGVLSPVIINQEAQMLARPMDRGKAPVLRRVTSGALFDAIQKEATPVSRAQCWRWTSWHPTSPAFKTAASRG